MGATQCIENNSLETGSSLLAVLAALAILAAHIAVLAAAATEHGGVRGGRIVAAILAARVLAVLAGYILAILTGRHHLILMA